MNKKIIKVKIKEWLNRYLIAELWAIFGAINGGLLFHFLFDNEIVTAIGATWSENIGYYGYILYKDFRDRKKKDRKLTFRSIIKVLRNEFIEFGLAEYLDSFIVRPAAMYYFPNLLNNVTLGLFVGKFAADITFYIPTIVLYEIRKKLFKD